MARRVTMNDIAQAVGVSKFAVSRALSGKSGVSELTRARIFDAVESLGYIYEGSKSGKDQQGEKHVVLAIPQPDLGDPEYWMHVVAGAEAAAREENINLVVRSISQATRPNEIVSPQTGGIIIAGSMARVILDHRSSQIPTVLLTYAKPLEKVDAVIIADFEGGMAAGEHLLRLGHGRFGFLGDTRRPSYRQRFLGFQEAIERQSHKKLKLFTEPNLNEGIALEARFRHHIQTGSLPSAIFCATDSLAMLTMWTLARLRVAVPEEVSVIGYNDTPDASKSVPPLTTLRVEKGLIGRLAIEKLIRRQTDPRTPYLRTAVTPELIERGSTAPYRPNGS